MSNLGIVPVIVSTNYKGGVGKTTTSRVLAQGIASDPEINKGKPVLIIDLDPQANTTRRWKLNTVLPDGMVVPIPHPELRDQATSYSSICDLWLHLIGAGDPVAPLPYETTNPLIHIVPAHEELMSEAMLVAREKRPVLGAMLRNWLRSPELAESYCCVIIDTQPSKSPLIDAALVAATHGYIPFMPEPQAVEGVMSMITYFVRFSRQRGSDIPLRFLGLLPNMVQNTRIHNLYLHDLSKEPSYGKFLMPVSIRRRIAYAETDSHANTPGQVTDIVGSDIDIEARRFVKYLWGEVMKDAAAMQSFTAFSNQGAA